MSGSDNYTNSAPGLGFDQAWIDDQLKNGSGRDLLAAQILSQKSYDKWSGEGAGSVLENARLMAGRLSDSGIKRLEDFGARRVQEGKPYTPELRHVGWLGSSTTPKNPNNQIQADADGEGNITGYYEMAPTGRWFETVMVDNGEGGQYGQPQIVSPDRVKQLDLTGSKPVTRMQDTDRVEYINKKTGEAINPEYAFAGGNVWGGTFAGDGRTSYGVTFNEMGMPVFYTQYGGSSSDWGKISGILSIAAMIPGPWTPFVMAANAIGNAYNGNYVGAALSALGAANAYGTEFLNTSIMDPSVPFDQASANLNSFSGTIAQNLPAIRTAAQAVGVLNAIDKGNLAGVISGLVNIAPQVGITIPADYITPINVAATASAVSKGDWAGALESARMLTDNPTIRQNVKLAEQGVKLVSAIESGDPARIFSSAVGFAQSNSLGASAVKGAAQQTGIKMSDTLATQLASSPDAERYATDLATATAKDPDFDPEAYNAGNSDVNDAFNGDLLKAASHYANNGIKEGRGLSNWEAVAKAKDPDFDPEAYSNAYSDIAAAFGEDFGAAARHFAVTGIDEGRGALNSWEEIAKSKNPDFDAKAYKDRYSDLAEVFGDDEQALARHFAVQGINEGRDPAVAAPAAPPSLVDDLQNAGLTENPDFAQPGAVDEAMAAFQKGQDAAALAQAKTPDVQEAKSNYAGEFSGMYFDPTYTDSVGNTGTYRLIPEGEEATGGLPTPTEDADAPLSEESETPTGEGEGEGEGTTAGGEATAPVEPDYLEQVKESVPGFDAQAYLDRYSDLKAAFGDDLDSAALHWLIAGQYEGRNPNAADAETPVEPDVIDQLTDAGLTETPSEPEPEVPVEPTPVEPEPEPEPEAPVEQPVDYMAEAKAFNPAFDAQAYLDRHSDLKAAYGDDLEAAARHYATWGGPVEGRDIAPEPEAPVGQPDVVDQLTDAGLVKEPELPVETEPELPVEPEPTPVEPAPVNPAPVTPAPAEPTPTPVQPPAPVTPPTAGITPAEVQKIVDDALKANPNLTASDVQKIVSDAVSVIPNLTSDQVKQIVGDELAKVPAAATPADVKTAVDAAKADLSRAIEAVGNGASSGINDLKVAIEGLKAAGLTPADVQQAVDASAANQSAATKQAIADATSGLATATQLSSLQRSLSDEIQAAKDIGLQGDAAIQAGLDSLAGKVGTNQSDLLAQLGTTASDLRAQFATDIASSQTATAQEIANTKTALETAIAEAKASGLQGDAALKSAIDAVAASQQTNAANLLSKMGTTEAGLKSEFQAGLAGVSADVDATRTALTEAIKAAQDMGLQGDAALKTAIDSVAATQQTSAADLLSKLGTTEAALRTEMEAGLAGVTTSIANTKAALEAAIADAKASGLSGNQALQSAISKVAADQKTSATDLLSKLGTTEAGLKSEFASGLAGVSAEVADTRKSLEDAIKAAQDIGLQGDAALQAAINSVAADQKISSTELLNQLGTTEAALRSDMQAGLAGVTANVADTKLALEQAIAAAQAAGMSGDQALQSAINKVAADQQTSAADLLSKLGTTEAGLKTEFAAGLAGVSADVAATRTALESAIKAAQDIGLQGDAALRAGIDSVAAQLGTTSEALLSQLGTTEAGLRQEFASGLAGVQTQMEQQYNALTAAQKAEADARIAQGQTLEQAIAAAQAATTGQISGLEAQTRAQYESLTASQKAAADALVAQGQTLQNAITAAKTEAAGQIAGVETRLTDAIAAAEAMGLSRDQAITAAVDAVASDLGTTRAALLAQLGTTEAGLRQEFASGISGLEAQTKAQYDSLSAAQKATADALVAQGQSMQQAITAAQQQTTGQIAGVESRLTDAIAAAEAMGLDRDQAITAAVDSIAAELGTTRNNLLSQLGTTETALRTEFGAGLSGVSAEVKTAYNSLSAEQKALANQLAQQGTDMASAIQQAQQQTQGQIGALSVDMQAKYNAMTAAQKAETDARVAQGQTLQDAITASQATTTGQIAGVNQQIAGLESQLTAQGTDFARQLAAQGMDYTTALQTAIAAQTQSFGTQISDLEARRQADVNAQLARERAAEEARAAQAAQAATAAKEAQRQAAVRTTLAQGQQGLKSVAQQLQAVQTAGMAPQQAQVVEAGTGFDISDALNTGFFSGFQAKKALQNQPQPTKIATGGYIDDLLAEGMSVDDLMNLLR